MNMYYVNKNAQANGDHEVHKPTCQFLPAEHNRLYLGTFYTCAEAVREAKKIYLKSDGCKFCIPECHTR